MTFPLINRIYKIDENTVVIWQQKLFFKVYLRTLESGAEGSIYYTMNWWKFMMNAKKLKKLEGLSENY